jgi:hypothetical protein
MVKASVKGNLNVLSAHGKTTRAAIVITISKVLQLWPTSHGFIEKLSLFPARKRGPKS